MCGRTQPLLSGKCLSHEMLSSRLWEHYFRPMTPSMCGRLLQLRSVRDSFLSFSLAHSDTLSSRGLHMAHGPCTIQVALAGGRSTFPGQMHPNARVRQPGVFNCSSSAWLWNRTVSARISRKA